MSRPPLHQAQPVDFMACADQGMTMTEAAAQIGVPHHTVEYFARKHGIKFAPARMGRPPAEISCQDLLVALRHRTRGAVFWTTSEVMARTGNAYSLSALGHGLAALERRGMITIHKLSSNNIGATCYCLTKEGLTIAQASVNAIPSAGKRLSSSPLPEAKDGMSKRNARSMPAEAAKRPIQRE